MKLLSIHVDMLVPKWTAEKYINLEKKKHLKLPCIFSLQQTHDTVVASSFACSLVRVPWRLQSTLYK